MMRINQPSSPQSLNACMHPSNNRQQKVHATGGMAALVMVILIGPQTNRFSGDNGGDKTEQSVVMQVYSHMYVLCSYINNTERDYPNLKCLTKSSMYTRINRVN